MGRRIRRKRHADQNDIKTQIDVAWATGMRAGIDEGKRQVDMEAKDLKEKLRHVLGMLDILKTNDKTLRDKIKRDEDTIKELRKDHKNVFDYIKRLERHLDSRSIRTTLIVRADGKPFNETSSSEKRLILRGIETGRFASRGPTNSRGEPVNAIDFSQIRPRGPAIGGRIAAAYGASQETIERSLARQITEGIVTGIDYAEGPDETALTLARAYDEAESTEERLEWYAEWTDGNRPEDKEEEDPGYALPA